MIQEGERKHVSYWGYHTARKVVGLEKPVECHNPEQGTVYFEPTIVQIEWERPPSGDRIEFWFPYWMIIGGKEKYGQYAPMMAEETLLELLQRAIRREFFSKAFLQGLYRELDKALSKQV